MPWCYMMLRGQRVLARCDRSGTPEPGSDGRVEVRYRPKDGRAYFAAARNLQPAPDTTVLPDDHCGEAERPEARGRGAAAKKKKLSRPTRPTPEVPEGDEVLVYADGACSGNPGPAGLGVVMLWDDQRQERSEYLGRATNNIAELTAILRAAEEAKKLARPVRIYTDSSYSIGVLTKGWKAKANRELVAAVREALAELDDVSLHHVPGHAGVPLNERADELARLALETRTSPGWVDVGKGCP